MYDWQKNKPWKAQYCKLFKVFFFYSHSIRAIWLPLHMVVSHIKLYLYMLLIFLLYIFPRCFVPILCPPFFSYNSVGCLHIFYKYTLPLFHSLQNSSQREEYKATLFQLNLRQLTPIGCASLVMNILFQRY